MVYRIHFTIHDLNRTRVAEVPTPLQELDCAVQALQDRSQTARLDSWRRRALSRLSGPARLAMSLISSAGWLPSLLDSSGTGESQEALEKLRGALTHEVAAQLAALAEIQPAPSWGVHLPTDADLRKELCEGLSDLYTVLVEPYWPQICERFAADRAVRLRHVLSGGVGELLARANGRWMRWEPPVLEIRTKGNRSDRDLHLTGQGVLLMPSAFAACSVVDEDAHPQPIIRYPLGLGQPLVWLADFDPAASRTGASTAVSALLGRTKAAVLNAIADHPSCTTKELAVFTRIALSSASEHATVLRAAGLIRSARYRNTVIHCPTGLGIALLNRCSGASHDEGARPGDPAVR